MLFLAASYLRECSSVLLHDFGHATAVNELAFPTAFHQAGFIQDFQVMRNSSGSDPLQGNDFAAIRLFFARNGL